MLNILKYFQQPPVEKYEFQEAERLQCDDGAFATPHGEAEGQKDDFEFQDDFHEGDAISGFDSQKQNLFTQRLQEAAQREADNIIQNAHAQAEKLIEEAHAQAEQELHAFYEEMRQKAYDEGFAQGREEGRRAGQEQAYQESCDQIRKHEERMLDEAERFLRDSAKERDQMLDRCQDEMRDLVLTIAEKVIRISLQSSGEIVARMVQHATEKLKHREWVRVYVQKGEAQRCVQADPELAACLSMLADQVKIVPLESDDPGTCILELPNEIIDASASTQMNNIRKILQDIES